MNEHQTRLVLAKDQLKEEAHHKFPMPPKWGKKRRAALEQRLEDARTAVCQRYICHKQATEKKRKSKYLLKNLAAEQKAIDLAEVLISMNAYETAELQLDKIV